jgi:type II secretory pathway component PulJ
MKLANPLQRWRKRTAAWTLLEMMIGVTAFSIAGAAIGSAYLFGLRSFKAMSNYSELNQQNREAMDLITREIRQAKTVLPNENTSTSTKHYLTLLDGSNEKIVYTFDSSLRQLTRTSNGVSRVLLDDCYLVKFNLGTRVPATNSSSSPYYPASDLNEAKIIDLTWKSHRTLPGGVINSEDIQTAKIVIRKHKLSGSAP